MIKTKLPSTSNIWSHLKQHQSEYLIAISQSSHSNAAKEAQAAALADQGAGKHNAEEEGSGELPKGMKRRLSKDERFSLYKYYVLFACIDLRPITGLPTLHGPAVAYQVVI